MQRSDVVGLLLILAEQTKESLSPERVEYIATELSALPGNQLHTALRKLIREARRFPTIAEIEEAMGIKGISDASRAAEAAARIEGAIVKFGSAGGHEKFKRQQEYMGELAWLVVERSGGYQHLCDTVDNDNLSTMKAQWRGVATALCDSSRAGSLDLAPVLPEGPVSNLIAKLADGADMRLKDQARLEGLREQREHFEKEPPF